MCFLKAKRAKTDGRGGFIKRFRFKIQKKEFVPIENLLLLYNSTRRGIMKP